MLLNFVIVQLAPGGPVEQTLAALKNETVGATARIGGGGSEVAAAGSSTYRGSQGLDPHLLEEIKTMYGFDKPATERFFLMVGNYLRFDFGNSFYQDRAVIDLILEKLPVSISLGLWTTLLVYLVSIPLGIKKALRDGSPFDVWSSAVVIVGYAIPGFLFAILLIVLFAGGSYWSIFPLRGLVSDHWESLPLHLKIVDYLWHITLPVAAMVISGFASLTMLTKNSFLEEIRKNYVRTAYAKGASSQQVLYGHIFRNAMLIIIAGFPAAFIGVLFTGSVLIEVIFSLDGMGLLGFEAAIHRDYPVLFGILFIFTAIGLLLNLVNDLMYVAVDPRIDFNSR